MGMTWVARRGLASALAMAAVVSASGFRSVQADDPPNKVQRGNSNRVAVGDAIVNGRLGNCSARKGPLSRFSVRNAP
jgi:hypothetical protein